MKTLFTILLCFFMALKPALAQHSKAILPNHNLSIKWEIIENNHDNKPICLTALTISPHNQFILPAKGWKIYFNFSELVIAGSATGNVNITHVNGDLFYISPASNFKALKPNDSLRTQFVATNWVINYTDAPQGFYLVWDNQPQKCYPINDLTIVTPTKPAQYMRSPLDKVGLNTSQLVYEQNKSIRDIPADSLIKIFPTPVSYQLTKSHFKLDAGVKLITEPEFKTEAGILKQELAKLLIPSVKNNGNVIKLIKKPMPAEAYELSITNTAITIAASSGAGIFYGIQSLKAMLPPTAWQHTQSEIILPGIQVTDKPRFGYRAIMPDVARNFQTTTEMLKLLDLMGLYKLNVLHFHLTDDEGWRLQIPSLPELTEIGATRGHTLDEHNNLAPALGSGPFKNDPHGSGYYTKADFIRILKYASARHITIIPEIETPGHARAAIKAMDARYRNLMAKGQREQASRYLLHDLKDSSKYLSVQYYNDNVIDVSLPSTYNFVETVTADLQSMYKQAGAPLKTIHFGGDEVPVGAWERSPSVLALMKSDTALKSIDDLWAYYYQRVSNILKKHNLYLTAWEEVGTKKVLKDGKKITVINPDLANQNIHLEVWNNVLGWGAEDLAYKLANTGYKVILSCVSNLYFDMAYNKDYNEPGYYWGGYADVDRSFSFIPLDYFKNVSVDRMGNALNPSALAGKEKLTEAGKANIVGLQGALWGETLKGGNRLEYMLLPKLFGLAERAWAKDPDWATEKDTAQSTVLYNEAWSQFLNVLSKRELPKLDSYTGGFNYRIPNVGAVIIDGKIVANSQLPGFIIRYTTNAQIPSVNSPAYRLPIPNTGAVRLRLFNTSGRGGRATAPLK